MIDSLLREFVRISGLPAIARMEKKLPTWMIAFGGIHPCRLTLRLARRRNGLPFTLSSELCHNVPTIFMIDEWNRDNKKFYQWRPMGTTAF